MKTELFQPAAPARDLDEEMLRNLQVIIRNGDLDPATRKGACLSLLNHFRLGTTRESVVRIESILADLLLERRQ